jgi:cytochrome c biogenesis protein CcdA/thiol-disulfide isomerase/thioredoxin
MAELVLIGVVAGILAAISPCILPVLPVVLVAGSGSSMSAPSSAADGPPGAPPQPGQAREGLARPLAVVIGLVLSFSLVVLAGSEILSLLHLPQDALRDAGIALLALVGLGYLIPRVGDWLERPFARLGARAPRGRVGGLVLGLALGVVYVPCAGPILAALTVVGATHKVGFSAVVLTAAFAVGTAGPLLVLAVAGGQLSRRTGAIRRRAPQWRRVGGAVLVVMAVAIGLNVFAGLQRDLPGYASALQGSAKVRSQLNGLTGDKHTSLASCTPDVESLVSCGKAPNFAGITAWLNTPGGRPLSLAGLRGKVVLVDFWTYSCVNCQRTLPHVEAWYRAYAKDGFVVVGVHTPEFPFEHVVSNVRSQSAALGVRYPVAIDDSYATWNAYDNEYWPADYLIDARRSIRSVHFGEGGYATTESLIRQLLTAAHPSQPLPARTDVPDTTPVGNMSPETYVGYQRLQYLTPDNVVKNAEATYHFPASLQLGALGLSGRWTEHAEEATAGGGAELELGFLAHDVYLVLGGTGPVSVSVGGKQTQTIDVHGVPRLYTLFHSAGETSGKLLLHVAPGVQVYDFTFG